MRSPAARVHIPCLRNFAVMTASIRVAGCDTHRKHERARTRHIEERAHERLEEFAEEVHDTEGKRYFRQDENGRSEGSTTSKKSFMPSWDARKPCSE